MTLRFVHLAPRAAIGHVRRHGLRMGTGVQGHGVYAVPLLGIPRKHRDDCHGTPRDRVMTSDRPVTSMTLWSFLFREHRPRRRNPVAVIFDPPAKCWPADLYLESNMQVRPAFLAGLAGARGAGFSVVDPSQTSCLPWFTHVRVRDAAAVGVVMHHLLDAGAHAWSDWEDRFELVFRRNVDAAAIRKLVPLCRGNREAREVRRAGRTRDVNCC